MREIKFRAWHIKEKTMFKPETLWFNQFNSKDVWLNNSHDYGDEKFRNKLYGYNGKDIILMQFTGLKDKNGKEIYEGDIIRECNMEDKVWEDSPHEGIIEECPTGIVDYEAPVFNIKVNSIGRVKFNVGGYSELHLSKYDGFYMWESADFEVIGNIYENPELLK